MTNEEYKLLRARIDDMNEWVDTLRVRGGGASYKPEDVPAHLLPVPTNEERSAVEVHEFNLNKPEKYFAYVSEKNHTVTTWTGDTLGSASFGCEFRGNMGDKRVPIRVNGVNGRTYSGTYYKSAGDYCRLRAVKS